MPPSVDRRTALQWLGAAALSGCAASRLDTPTSPPPCAASPEPAAAPPPVAQRHEDLPLMSAPKGPPQAIAMLVYPRMTALDLVGPQLMLASLMNVRVHLVWKDLSPIPCDTGFSIVPTTTFADCPADVEVLFVPGGTTGTLAVMEDPEVLAFLADRGSRARWVTSVCTGALVLRAAGLLRGYRATTHWMAREQLRGLDATPVDQRVVIDRNRVTGAGVSAGLDLGLQLAIELRGERYARAVALNAEYAPAPPVSAGTPASAGAEATELLRTMYAPFLASVDAASQRARTRWGQGG